MSEAYSDLQVVQPSEYSGLQTGAEKRLWVSAQATDVDTYKIHDDEAPPTASAKRRICGLDAKTFYIAAAIIFVVVVGAAVGGGVGGSLSSKKSSTSSTSTTNNASQSASTTSESASSTVLLSTVTSSTPPTLTTTEIIGPSATLLRDCPSSNNTIYDVTLGSTQMSFRKICNLSFLNSINGGNSVDRPTNSLDDCINLCAAYNIQNQTEIAAGTSSICNAVCWRNRFTDDDFPGQCFGFTTMNSSGTFVVTQDSKCDAAAWINQSFG